MSETMSEFVQRLHGDARFRKRFAGDPAGELRKAGLDPDAFELPERIDPDALAKRLDAMLPSATAEREGALDRLDAQQLWDEFGWIRWKPGADTASIAVAVVIYGVSMVTSQTSSVTVVGRQIHTVEQLARLRALARQPADQLRFAVIGADGERVEGLNADVLRAFVERLG